MKTKLFHLTVFFLLTFIAFTPLHADMAGADSWKKQATDTRGIVAGVLDKLSEAYASTSELVKELVDDARMQLKSGDESYGKAEKQYKGKDYDTAASNFNLAWQYYVKSATAALRANSILSE